MLVVAYFTGYLLADFLVKVVAIRDTSEHSILNLFHIIFELVGTCIALYVQKSIGAFAFIILITEVTRPFICFQWLLSFDDKRETPIYKFNLVVMILTFFIFKIIFIGWLLTKISKTLVKLPQLISSPHKRVLFFCAMLVYPILILIDIEWLFRKFTLNKSNRRARF